MLKHRGTPPLGEMGKWVLMVGFWAPDPRGTGGNFALDKFRVYNFHERIFKIIFDFLEICAKFVHAKVVKREIALPR